MGQNLPSNDYVHNGFRPGCLENDRLRWRGSSSGIYSSKSFCDVASLSSESLDRMWARGKWEVVLIPKEANEVADNLAKRGINISHDLLRLLPGCI
ncbi:hypothetical protein V6N13_108200 [Hibiscus sabdariffa]|uniref:RNase H type-1 domain-containing protein n=1 Tax=Hibiscus sabdariffa TaxID=183260 RepID=A0ABR2SRH8_9ROSI